MERLCFFCRKPLPLERRAEIYCSLRCQSLQRDLAGAPTPEASSPSPQPQQSAKK